MSISLLLWTAISSCNRVTDPQMIHCTPHSPVQPKHPKTYFRKLIISFSSTCYTVSLRVVCTWPSSFQLDTTALPSKFKHHQTFAEDTAVVSCIICKQGWDTREAADPTPDGVVSRQQPGPVVIMDHSRSREKAQEQVE